MNNLLLLIALLFILSFNVTVNAVENNFSKTSFTSNSVPMSGDYTIGISASYTRITDAVNDLNARGQSGAVRFLLVDASYTSETLPIVIQNSTASSTNTLTIQPNTGVTSNITGSSSSGIFHIATYYVTINGDNLGGSVGRDLTIRNTSVAAISYVIGLYNFGVSLTASNCNIKNINLFGGVSWGIVLNNAGGNYDNVVIDNNQIQRTNIGIQFTGVSGATSDNGKITNNVMGSSIDSLSIFRKGVLTSYTNSLEISGNRIRGQVKGNSVGSENPLSANSGITISTGSINSSIFKNIIHDFYYNDWLYFGAFGIVYAPGATTNTGTTQIYNNMIYDIKGHGNHFMSPSESMGYLPQGICVYSNGTAAVNIYFNSIYLSGKYLSKDFSGSSACIGIRGNVGNNSMNVRNNILQNSQTQDSAAASADNHAIGIWVPEALTPNAFTNINYNDYYINGVNPLTGVLVSNATTLAQWKILTGKDANSIDGDPKFVSTDNLSIYAGSAAINAGTPIAGITTDIFGTTRNAVTPTIGADESPSNIAVISFRLEAVQLTRKDTVSVSLRSTVAPYPVIETSKGVYDSTSGLIVLPVSSAVNGSSYYLTVSHRNSITTWSAAPVLCNFNIIGYDFTTATAQAYGSNMKIVSGKASYFTGDVDRNGLVDLTDVIAVYNASTNFITGSYEITDLNYNGIVDLTDVLYASNNSSAFVQQKNP